MARKIMKFDGIRLLCVSSLIASPVLYSDAGPFVRNNYVSIHKQFLQNILLIYKKNTIDYSENIILK